MIHATGARGKQGRERVGTVMLLLLLRLYRCVHAIARKNRRLLLQLISGPYGGNGRWYVQCILKLRQRIHGGGCLWRLQWTNGLLLVGQSHHFFGVG